jgi:hypothetical protein
MMVSCKSINKTEGLDLLYAASAVDHKLPKVTVAALCHVVYYTDKGRSYPLVRCGPLVHYFQTSSDKMKH